MYSSFSDIAVPIQDEGESHSQSEIKNKASQFMEHMADS